MFFQEWKRKYETLEITLSNLQDEIRRIRSESQSANNENLVCKFNDLF